MTLLPGDIATMREVAAEALGSSVEFSNAILQQIRGPGAVDGYGENTGLGTILWSGNAHGVLEETDRRMLDERLTTQGGTTPVQALAFLMNLGAADDIPAINVGDDQAGYTVVIEDHRVTPAVDRRFRVVGMEDRMTSINVPGLRLELDDEQTV